MKSIANNVELAKNTTSIRARIGSSSVSSRGVTDGVDDCVRAIINATNLQTLRLVPDYDAIVAKPSELLWLQLFDQADSGASTQSFAYLNTLTIVTSAVYASDLESVFRLPCLESLTLETVYQKSVFAGWTLAERSSSIKALDLSHCFIDSVALAQLISYPKALEDLTYSYDFFCAPDSIRAMDRPTLSWPVIGDAVRKHKQSLRRLVLTQNTDAADGDQTSGPSGLATLGSLRDCHQLRDLETSLYMLMETGHCTTKSCRAVFPRVWKALPCARV
jgi:hypothetical protein